MPAHEPPAAPDVPSATGHTATAVEHGAFSVARCGCGWQGPARRSRDRARADAAAHSAQAEAEAGVPPQRPPAP
ncbi:hypothetical protein [Streptomyces sp. ODS05-4]|uniref:hypothetical protein n=1 Tax=Streptomyces sp. ODS05-4 TaxID=2944939 RepID=UPI00210A2FE7|nr:hypothetical protein [Streptomyces sp. ODS05-4]